MISQDQRDPVDRLVRLGLTTYEARAYWGLVHRSSSSPAELARVTGVPRQRVYDVLDKLVERGLAAMRPGRTVRYAAVPPDTALERLLAEHRHRLAGAEQDAGVLATTLRAVFEEGAGHAGPLDYIEVVRDRSAIANRFAELHRTAKQEILTFAKPPYVVTTSNNPEGMAAARRGTLRTVYELGAFDDPVFLAGVRRFVAAGEQARFVPDLPLKISIVDRRTVMFGMADPVAGGGEITTVVIEHPQIAVFLRIAFESIWAAGVSFEEAAALAG